MKALLIFYLLETSDETGSTPSKRSQGQGGARNKEAHQKQLQLRERWREAQGQSMHEIQRTPRSFQNRGCAGQGEMERQIKEYKEYSGVQKRTTKVTEIISNYYYE